MSGERTQQIQRDKQRQREPNRERQRAKLRERQREKERERERERERQREKGSSGGQRFPTLTVGLVAGIGCAEEVVRDPA